MSSSFKTFNNCLLEFRIFKYPLISSTNDFKLLKRSSLSRAVSFCNLNSRIAFAWSSSKEIFDEEDLKLGLINFIYCVILDLAVHLVESNFVLASAGFLDFLIKSIIASMLLTAIDNPIRMLAFSLALLSLNTVLLVMTSFLKSMK